MYPQLSDDHLQSAHDEETRHVPAGTSVAGAARVMNERNVGSVFVRMNDNQMGMVLEPDIVRKVVGESKPAYFVQVESIMSTSSIRYRGACLLSPAGRPASVTTHFMGR